MMLDFTINSRASVEGILKGWKIMNSWLKTLSMSVLAVVSIFLILFGFSSCRTSGNALTASQIIQKLESIEISEVRLVNVDMPDIVDWITQLIREQNTSTKSVTVRYKLPPEPPFDGPLITLHTNNISVWNLIKTIESQGILKVRVKGCTVWFMHFGDY